jgi:hypothetical protein
MEDKEETMPVKLSDQPKCGVCGREKKETNRWFLIRIVNSEFSYRPYNSSLLAEYDEAICGLECLDKRSRGHAEKLIGMRSGGSQAQSSQDIQTGALAQ